MKAISICTYDRPQYLKRALKALAAADGIDEYEVFVSVDTPRSRVLQRRVLVALKSFAKQLKLHIHVQPERKGIIENTYNAPALAIAAGADSVVVVEEDVVLAPDALRMAEWYTAQPLPDTELCLTLFNWSPDVERPYELLPGDHFAPWGFAFSRDQWDRLVGRYWRDDCFRKTHFPDAQGWDWNIQAARIELGLSVTMPYLNRAKHVGRVGAYVTAQSWAREHQNKPLAAIGPGGYVLNSSTALA